MVNFQLTLTSSTVNKIFEIFSPILEQNANFGPIFEKSADFGPIFEKSVSNILSMVNEVTLSLLYGSPLAGDLGEAVGSKVNQRSSQVS